jgi:hypothetical protein
VPDLTRDRAISAWWYFGTQDKAARALGIDVKTFRRALEGKQLRSDSQARVDAAWGKLSKDAQYSIRNGIDFIRSLSPGQARVLKGELKGSRFARAVRDFRRIRRVPPSVFGFIDEIGSP